MMNYPDVDEFLDGVFNTIRKEVHNQKQQHPEDIMTTVSFMAETIYQFVSNLPSGINITQVGDTKV